jgi:type I restriction-modification system DNA methylase subunit
MSGFGQAQRFHKSFRTVMNLGEIEQQVGSLDTKQGFELIYDLLRAYGLPKASIARLRNGSHNRSDREDECLWKGKVYYHFVQSDHDLHDVIDDAATDARILKERPRFLIVRDSDHLLALDTKTSATLDTPLVDLQNHFEFLLPWAGIEKTHLENLNYADVKAAEKMARLYDEIIKHNSITTAADVHHLNVFFSRLLFCFFAEDTKVFEPGQFTNAIASTTNPNGEDVHTFLDELFNVLNTEQTARIGVPSRFRGFGYVNGNLFNQPSGSPTFSAKARKVVLECGTLDWSQINPDIFGSMIQAVVHPSQREGLGMHYTSVENIMKVIRPLFLDDLLEAFESAADSPQRLKRLLSRIFAIRVFDPACGSGNFLVIAYKELRKLEHSILQRLSDLDPAQKGLFNLSGIKLENFYGIEIDDFAHEIAILSLWLAKHQMNVEFHELFGVEIALIPLKDTANVSCGNAIQLDWDSICPEASEKETYVVGNPPYLGSSQHTDLNRSDLVKAFGARTFDRRMDYVSAWFMKGAEYIVKHNCRLGFVSTNSICQGSHVEMLWPHILAEGASIAFAHTSFKWTNQAKGNAGVTVVVVGLSAGDPRDRTLYTDGTVQRSNATILHADLDACYASVEQRELSSSGRVTVGH